MIYDFSGAFVYQPPIAGFPGEFLIHWAELSDTDALPAAPADRVKYDTPGSLEINVCQGYPQSDGLIPLSILSFEALVAGSM